MSAIWKERPELGNRIALRMIIGLAFGLGRTIARAALYPSALYFLLRRGAERRASLQFLSRVKARPASLSDVYRHILSFSQATLDRLYLVTERFRRFDIRCSGLADLDRALDGGRGMLLVGAHLGSFEALRVLSLERPDVPIRILLDLEQGPAVSRTLNALNPAMAATILDVRSAGPTAAISIKQALDRNAIVAMLADRALPGQDMQPVQFFGCPARLPTAPWLLAAALKVPVILAFGLYRGGNRYDLHFETFSEAITLDRNQRAAALSQILQRFADRLAHYAQLAPDNWFNFYDFWHDPTSGDASGASRGAGNLLRRA
jgi:predicted LPLAT superfamily acyltransferase